MAMLNNQRVSGRASRKSWLVNLGGVNAKIPPLNLSDDPQPYLNWPLRPWMVLHPPTSEITLECHQFGWSKIMNEVITNPNLYQSSFLLVKSEVAILCWFFVAQTLLFLMETIPDQQFSHLPGQKTTWFVHNLCNGWNTFRSEKLPNLVMTNSLLLKMDYW